MNKKVLVIAPHPDDEVLGCGGSIKKLVSQGWDATVAVVTKGVAPLFTEQEVMVGRAEAKEAHQLLGVTETVYMDFPAAELDIQPHRELNQAVTDLLTQVKPDLMFIPFIGDLHRDHQRTFISCLVAARPFHEYQP